jgi:signal transduction histidine kinase
VPKAIPAGPATIAIRYSARLNDQLRGFYLSHGNGRDYAVTQLEATDARRAFPSFDEPALKATFDIALTIEQTHARVAVTDHGIGIAKEDQARIFDRFYRTDDARAHTKKGTGLGLAICAWITESHRGRLEVQSKVGEGSTFTVILPLAPASTNRMLKKAASVTDRSA